MGKKPNVWPYSTACDLVLKMSHMMKISERVKGVPKNI